MQCASVYWLAVVCVVCVACVAAETHAKTTDRSKFCGSRLSDVLRAVCRTFNSPTWEKNNKMAGNRVKRNYSIIDECCKHGCTWDDLRMYCADDNNVAADPQEPLSEEEGVTSSPQSAEQHVIADRSVEAAAADDETPAIGFRTLFGRSEMRSRGVARSAPVVGTVSPLLVWGRTVHADQPSRERFLYVTI